MKLVIVKPLNDQNGRKYLFESEFDDTPYTAKNIKPGAIVHCETCYKKGMLTGGKRLSGNDRE